MVGTFFAFVRVFFFTFVGVYTFAGFLICGFQVLNFKRGKKWKPKISGKK